MWLIGRTHRLRRFHPAVQRIELIGGGFALRAVVRSLYPLIGALVLTLTVSPAGSALAQPAPPSPPISCRQQPTKIVGFEDRPWFQPLPAAPREAQMQLLGFGLSHPSEYMTRPGYHKVWDVTLGKELPLFVVSRAARPDRMDKGCWGAGLWFPVDSHFLLDFTEDQQPIINNGYHVAFAGKVIYGLTDRDQIAAKVEVEHESDHMSDEAVINALGMYGDQFKRIDINYQSLEVGVSWDRRYRLGTITHRFSTLWTLDGWGHPGFYSPSVHGHGAILPSTRNYEPAYGFQFMPAATHGLRPYVSFDARLRTILNYSKQRPGQKESSQFSPALVIGLRDFGHKNVPDLIFKAYYGVNPNGQFGKQDGYRLFAAGFQFR